MIARVRAVLLGLALPAGVEIAGPRLEGSPPVVIVAFRRRLEGDALYAHGEFAVYAADIETMTDEHLRARLLDVVARVTDVAVKFSKGSSNGWRRCERSRHPHDWNLHAGQRDLTTLPKPAVMLSEPCMWHLTKEERRERMDTVTDEEGK